MRVAESPVAAPRGAAPLPGGGEIDEAPVKKCETAPATRSPGGDASRIQRARGYSRR